MRLTQNLELDFGLDAGSDPVVSLALVGAGVVPVHLGPVADVEERFRLVADDVPK